MEKGLEPSRERAKALVMEGCVYADGRKVEKPGEELPAEAVLEIRGQKLRYASRGWLKLEKAVASFGVALEGCVCMDVG
ncbi:MAG: S4 domain-containing protein, partial [Clostridia bacterium]|nr:S4 domain-containing protein [Clostridia bacterium]